MKKILVMFSNGLDSRLVVKLLKEQIGANNLVAVYCLLPFGSRYSNVEDAKKFIEKEGVEWKLLDFSEGELLDKYLEMIRKPKYSRGKALNPCIDCKILMLNEAKKFADKKGISLIATGDVLGERPMSQNLGALKKIENDSDLTGRILRPLSAKLLPEIKTNLDSNKFLDVQGRVRKKQLELAKTFKMDFPTPAGGCLLCEPNFVKKIKPLLEKKKVKKWEIELTKIGRHFFDGKIVLGKNKKENDFLKELKSELNFGHLIIPIPEKGPSAFVLDETLIPKSQKLIKKYSKKSIEDFKIVN
jgi:tRNA-uridine 2-sulfurtransferase